MLDVKGIVTFAGELESKSKPGVKYTIVNIDGLRAFPLREMETLPQTGQEILAKIGVQTRDGRDNYRLYSWAPVANGEG